MLKFRIPHVHSEELLQDAITGYRWLKNPTEENLHDLIAYYIRVKYPDVIFRTDAGGLKLSIGTALKFNKKQSRDRIYPDLFIVEPRGEFSGLFIELKRETENLYNKNGELKNEHYKEQKKMLDLLYAKGYYTTFGVGFMASVDIINAYLNLK